MRFRLRTLMIVLAVGPPVLAAAWWIRSDLLKTSPRDLYILLSVFVVGAAAFSVLLTSAALWYWLTHPDDRQ